MLQYEFNLDIVTVTLAEKFTLCLSLCLVTFSLSVQVETN